MAERAPYAKSPIAHLHPAKPRNPVPIPTTEERKEAINFYSGTRWRKLRAAILANRPLCKNCLDHGQTTLGQEVHHVKKRVDRPDLAYDLDNLVVLCKPCHQALPKDQR